MVSTNTRNVDRDSVWDLRRQACRWYNSTTPLSLWIVPADSTTALPIERIRELDGALVLRRLAIRRDWKIMDDDAFCAAITFAVNELAVSSLVICGHSACGGSGGKWSDPCDRPSPRERLGYQRLLRSLQARQEQLNSQRQQVVDLLQELTDSPLIWKAVRLGRVSVHGMFYLAESGLFTLYDPRFGRFVSLGEKVSGPNGTSPNPKRDSVNGFGRRLGAR